MRFSIALIALAIATCPAVSFGEAPKASVTSLSKLPRPLPIPYNEQADAASQLDAAFARARASNKRVLVDFGGNWCPDCRILAGVMEIPEIAIFVKEKYEVVNIDVGQFNRNLSLVQRMGVRKLKGVPTVVIATADGQPLNVSTSAYLANAGSMTPQGIANWLAKFAD